MSQEFFLHRTGRVKSKSDTEHSPSGDNSDAPPPEQLTGPAFVAVGSGPASEHTSRLQTLLGNDSGYGGSVTSGKYQLDASHGGAAVDDGDRHQAVLSSRAQLDLDRRSQGGAIQQLHYNAHRVALARSINLAVELLKELREINANWPAHYPTVQGAYQAVDIPEATRSTMFPPRSAMHRSATTEGPFVQPQPTTSSVKSRPPSSFPAQLRRSVTSAEDGHNQEAESSHAAERRAASMHPPSAEPRLVSAQIAREFSVLKLDLKLGSLHQAELVHSLEKASVASLLDGKINTSISHLQSLRERIEDTSSKVLVTGDLNAGKSTFCNALLRRKILPEDQQPCTNIFCEVLDARANNGLEEVHAVHRDAIYDRDDESTYDVYPLGDLERIVTDNLTYLQCKIYVRDGRPIDESLLNNGVVDIALIDAPGLNSEMTKTTAVFARQEEIDVVVFVLSAANHFTISARDFITVATAEKAYLFIVVNGFDNIRDKQRCQKMILDQVKDLSPHTFKEAPELVHFVSSNAIPAHPSPRVFPNSDDRLRKEPGGDDDGAESDNDRHPNKQDKGKGKDIEKIRDFGILEQSLRRFVLEKRSRSKLAPAKNYLLNILGDINALATANVEVAQSERQRVNGELRELELVLESSRMARVEAEAEVEGNIEKTCSRVYDHTRSTLASTIQTIGHPDLFEMSYPGVWGAFGYAEKLKAAMLTEVSAAVTRCEDHARARTIGGVNAIRQLGLRHLGDAYAELSFRPDVMFCRRRDMLARHADIPTELWDFVDWSTLLYRQEKMAGTGMALTVVTALGGRLLGGQSWVEHALKAVRILDNDVLRRLVVPGVLLAAIAASAFVIRSIPQSLPHRLAAKISAHLSSTDYIHANSARISGSVRKVLRIPADSVKAGLQRSAEQLITRRDEGLRTSAESNNAINRFGGLIRKSADYMRSLEELDLDSQSNS